MTIDTRTGYHHGRVRGINFRPDIRGNDYSKGKSLYDSPLPRRQRFEDREANILSKQVCCLKSIPVELSSLNDDDSRLEDIELETQPEDSLCYLCPFNPLYPQDPEEVLKVAQV